MVQSLYRGLLEKYRLHSRTRKKSYLETYYRQKSADPLYQPLEPIIGTLQKNTDYTLGKKNQSTFSKLVELRLENQQVIQFCLSHIRRYMLFNKGRWAHTKVKLHFFTSMKCKLVVFRILLIIEHTCGYCTVGSYASLFCLSCRLSVCLFRLDNNSSRRKDQSYLRKYHVQNAFSTVLIIRIPNKDGGLTSTSSCIFSIIDYR